jgi:alpha-beta hydrolase superfamily lysophospholipase
VQTNEFHITCADEHKMPMYEWLSNAEPACILYMVHGMAEHGKRYAPIAEMLTQQGIAVYAHDNIYHGAAVENTDQLGIANNNWFYKQVDNIKLAVEYLRKKHPSKKIFLLGHSMGSFLCQRFFQLYGNKIDGLILSATNGKEDPLMGIGIAIAYLQYKLLGKQHRSHLIDTLSFGKFNKAFTPNRTTHDWLSKDEYEVDMYIADPYCGFVCSSGFFYYFFKGIKDAFKKENIAAIPSTVPVYCFAGDKDPVGLNGKGFLQLIQNWKNAGAKNITYRLYENGRHEMLNETNRTEVVSDLIEWIKSNL